LQARVARIGLIYDYPAGDSHPLCQPEKARDVSPDRLLTRAARRRVGGSLANARGS